MSLEGVVGTGITKRPPHQQQCPDARRAEAHEGTVEPDAGPWIARKKVTALAVCLVALPVLMTTVSRREAPWTAASSFWPLASTSTQGTPQSSATIAVLWCRRNLPRIAWFPERYRSQGDLPEANCSP